MGVAGEKFKVPDAKVTRPDFEECPEDQRTECGVPAGASAGNRYAGRICLLVLDDEPGGVGAVLNIDDAPSSAEPVSVFASIAGASTVINIQDGVAATGPKLSPQIESAGGGGRPSAMALDDQGRQFLRRRDKGIVERSVVPGIDISSRVREFDECGRR